MTPWPRSIVGRMTALIVTFALLSLALQLAALRWLIVPPLESLERSVAQSVNAVHAVLSRAPAAERSGLAAQLTSDDFTVIEAPLSGADLRRTLAPASPMAEQLQRSFEQRIRPGIAVRLDDDPPSMATFDFELDGQPWRVLHQARPPQWGVVGLGLGWLMLLAAATSAGLLVGGLWIARPLSRLARELAAQDDQLGTLTVRRRAGAEVQGLVRAFNRAVAKARRAEARRRVQLAGVSHDLAAPLTRIRLRVETQCDDALADALMGDLDMVQRVASQLIEFMQADSAAAQGQPAAVRSLAADIVARYVDTGQAVRLIDGSADAWLPDTALHRVLDNLIANAFAHAAGPVEVALEERPAASPSGREAVLTVWDHGPGLSDADFLQAQRPFVRLGLAEPRREAGGHCGLGLAIVAQIAHRLGGGLEPRRDRSGRFGVAMHWPMDKADSSPG